MELAFTVIMVEVCYYKKNENNMEECFIFAASNPSFVLWYIKLPTYQTEKHN